jgi:hypothetical protein
MASKTQKWTGSERRLVFDTKMIEFEKKFELLKRNP